MLVASWNVRGLNKRSHQKKVINLIKVNKFNFIGLLETKVKAANFVKVTKKVNKNWSWINNLEHHENGRIISGWDSSCWNLTVWNSLDQHITFLASFVEK